MSKALSKEQLLWNAASDGAVEQVEALCARGDVNVNFRKKRTMETPLHEAAGFDYADVVRVLVSFGAALDPISSRDETPVETAAGNYAINALYALKEAGASFECRVGSASVFHRLWEILKLEKRITVLAGKDARFPDEEIKNVTRTMRALLHCGASVNDVFSGETPLDMAAEVGYSLPAKLLLASGAQMNKAAGKPIESAEIAAAVAEREGAKAVIFDQSKIHAIAPALIVALKKFDEKNFVDPVRLSLGELECDFNALGILALNHRVKGLFKSHDESMIEYAQRTKQNELVVELKRVEKLVNDSRAKKDPEREEAKLKDMIIVDIEDDVPALAVRAPHGAGAAAGGAGRDPAGR